METWKAINSLRVVRDFAERTLSDDEVRRIVNAGRRAGSSKNSQRWGFVVVRERTRLRQLAEAGPFAGHLARAPVAVALVTPDPHADDAPLSVIWDLGRAAQNMVLAAWELGIGSCPATVYEPQRVKELLGIPADHHCEYLLSFGYPADPSVLTAPKASGGRRALQDVLHQERWRSFGEGGFVRFTRTL